VSPSDPTRDGGAGTPSEGEADGGENTSREELDSLKTHATARERPGDDATATAAGPVHVVSRHTFAVDDVVAGRYRVVRFIARGGMGEVYEVEDLELGEKVALKTICPELAATDRARERFKREILLARKVTHPNVCRIFDLGYHVVDEEQVTFLTMELLQGQSLGARLHGEPMGQEESLELIRQMADGLGAAHQAGIVHRDFKPANVVLVPGEEGPRAVITDFGLARTDAAGRALADVTGTGEVLGTPAYMAPEQLEGRRLTAATDVYALGLVVYEMATGARPFDGDTAFQIALMRLQGPPTAPSEHRPDLDPVWEQAILRCLAMDPSERFASTGDVVRALTGESVAPPARRSRGWRDVLQRSATRWALAVVALLAVGAVAATVALRWRGSPPVGSDRRSVAVLGFANISQDHSLDWVSTALAEILTSELAAGGALRTVPGETVARARIELGVTTVQTMGRETLGRLRKNLGSDLVVLGSYAVLPGSTGAQVRLDLRVQDTDTGLTPATASETGLQDDLFELAILASSSIRSQLGVGGRPAGVRGAAASLPTEPLAARYYSEGVDRLRRFEPLAARELLEKAVEADPTSPLACAELAKTWSVLGYDTRAMEVAERAFELSTDLGREDRLRVEGQYLMAAKRWDDACRCLGSLWSFFPDNLEYGLLLAEGQIAGGRAEEALATVAELRALPAPASEDPRIDLKEAAAAAALGDFRRQEDAAGRAVEAGLERGARLLVAEGRLAQARALQRLGRSDEAEAAAREALEISREAGNRTGVGSALHALGVVAYGRGNLELAGERFAESLAVRRQVGDRNGEAADVIALGGVVWRQGDLLAARDRFVEAQRINREVDNQVGLARAIGNEAVVLQQQGDLTGAIDRLQQVLSLQQTLGDRNGEAQALKNIASSQYATGDLGGARRSFEQALGIFRQIESRSEAAATLFGLGEVLLWQGELIGSRKRHQEALELRRELGESNMVVLSELALASVSLQGAYVGRGGFEEAAAAMEGAAGAFAEMGATDFEASALCQVGDARLAQGRAAEARDVSDRAVGLLETVGDVSTRISVAMTAARVEAAEGRHEPAIARLRELLDEAVEAEILGLELELRLAIGEELLAAGLEDEGRRRLQQLRQDATARGWILVADKVEAVLEGRG